MRTNSNLELDTNFHDLRARNFEIGAGPLRVMVHERKQHFAPSRHVRPPAGRDYAFSGPAGAGETVRMGVNGGEEEIRNEGTLAEGQRP